MFYKVTTFLLLLTLIFIVSGCEGQRDTEVIAIVDYLIAKDSDGKYVYKVGFIEHDKPYYTSMECYHVLPHGFPVPMLINSSDPSDHCINRGTVVSYLDKYQVEYRSHRRGDIRIYITSDNEFK